MDKFRKKINEIKSQKLPYVLVVGNNENNKIEVWSQGLTEEGIAWFLSTANMLADPTKAEKA